jgi:uncharacterized protein RhaS with RHS repeats
MGHRYYDTRIGRFLSQDPIGDGDNWYAYADNSPTNEIDPSGLEELAPSTDPSVLSDFWNHPELYGGCNVGDTFQGWTWNGAGWQQGPYSAPGASAGPSGSGASAGSDDTGPSMAQDVAAGFGVGISAVASQASFGLYNGGAVTTGELPGIILVSRPVQL